VKRRPCSTTCAVRPRGFGGRPGVPIALARRVRRVVGVAQDIAMISAGALVAPVVVGAHVLPLSMPAAAQP
jgi:hypothetical protein